MKVYVVGEAYNYATWIPKAEVVDTPEKADLLIFTGGEDVYPGLYDERPHPRTYFNIERDIQEVMYYKNYRSTKKFLGICRGSQFLTVMNKGKLFQHVENHAGVVHPIQFESGEVLPIISTHHQMSNLLELPKSDYKLLAWSSPSRCIRYEGNGWSLEAPLEKEPEVIYFPKTKSLCIQGHPEMMSPKDPVVPKCLELIDQLMEDKL